MAAVLRTVTLAAACLIVAATFACGGNSDPGKAPLDELRRLTNVPAGTPALVFVYADP